MERKIVNSAAGTAMTDHGDPTLQRNRIRYQIGAAVLDKLLHDGELSERDHEIAKAILARQYNLSWESIFR